MSTFARKYAAATARVLGPTLALRRAVSTSAIRSSRQRPTLDSGERTPGPRVRASSSPSVLAITTSVFELPPSTPITYSATHTTVRERGQVRMIRLDQRVEHRHRDVPLPYQWVGDQRSKCGAAVAGARRFDGEHLVGGHGLHEPEHLRRERRHLDGMRTVEVDQRRHLDDGLVGESGDRATVTYVDVMVRTIAGEQRRHESGGRLAVVRAAALLEQARLMVERRVGVHVQQRLLDAQHLGRTVLSDALMMHLVVRAVEVAQVVARDRADGAHEFHRKAGVAGDVVDRITGECLG